jgi:FkbM family methyltransferase
MRQKLYQLSYYYGLEKLVTKAEIRDGLGYVELRDGSVFYGQKDALEDARLVISKLRKLHVLQDYGVLLSLICYQYVAKEYERYRPVIKGDIVVDAGANIGTFTIKSARTVGDEGLVVAIEPERENLEILRMNVKANNLKNVVIVRKGVWWCKEILELQVARHQAGHSLLECKGFHSEYDGKRQKVSVDTLDSILKDLGVRHVDFLKVDIEGAEAVSRRGMADTLSDKDIYVVAEVSHIYQGQPTGDTVKRFLWGMGFETREKGDLIYGWSES